MYICTPHSLVIALDAVTGQEQWRFDPRLQQPTKLTTQHLTCRGVSYHDGSAAGRSRRSPPPRMRRPPRSGGWRRACAEVTTGNAGVAQNVVTGKAKPGDPNPTVRREAPAARVRSIPPA